MGRKVDLNTIKDFLDKDGYSLLEDKYISAKTSMRYLCRKHNIIHSGKWSDIKQNKYGCPECKKERLSKSNMLKYEDVLLHVESRGYKLISKEYNGNKNKLKMFCNIHGQFEMTYDTLKNGAECQKCAREKTTECNTKYDYQFAFVEFKKKNLTLLSDRYINYDSSMEYMCDTCENVSRMSLNNLLHGRGCKKCYIESIRGENSKLWKGGLTKQSKINRNRSEYLNWRNNVYKRDNYTCKKCMKKGGELQAHHIYNFSEYEELRYDINNGITLCKKCHSPNYKGSFHSIYGTKNNSIEQLEEFLGYKLNLNLADKLD